MIVTSCRGGARHVEEMLVGPYPVVVFDLDGTLLLGTSVSRMLAQWLGRTREIAALERAFDAREITSRVIAERSAPWFAGQHTTEIWRALEDGPWIAGMTETFQALTDSGASIVLGTITWRFAAEMLREHGFAAISGTEMQAADGCFLARLVDTSTSTIRLISSRSGVRRTDTR